MLRGLLVVLILLTGIQGGYNFVSPVVKNRMLAGKMRDLSTSRGMKREADVRRDLMKFIIEKDIPLTADAIMISSDRDRLSIAAHYRVDASFWFLERTYDFYPASDPSASLQR